jgi:hypothetical protein
LSLAVIPTGVAGFFLHTEVWCAGHGVEGPWQHFNQTQIARFPAISLVAFFLRKNKKRSGLPERFSIFDFPISTF